MNSPGKDFEWVWSDPSHLEAHIRDFLVHPSELLEELYPAVLKLMPEEAEILAANSEHEELGFLQSFNLSRVVGNSGLRNVCEDESPSFWGYRIGRRIPSHLCLGSKEPTARLCLWGRWEPGKFIIHTMYPGEIAPREIHDPALSLEELDEAIDFWRCHAIVVNKDEYHLKVSDT
jgi:hypothetical protein